jgi:hypothetical protein
MAELKVNGNLDITVRTKKFFVMIDDSKSTIGISLEQTGYPNPKVISLDEETIELIWWVGVGSLRKGAEKAKKECLAKFPEPKP